LYALGYKISKKLFYRITTNNLSKIFWDRWDATADQKSLDSNFFLKQKYNKYKNYLVSFFEINKVNDVEAIIILQPVPQIGKNLTEEEKNLSKHQDYRDIIVEFKNIFNTLNKDNGFKTYDFTNIFINEEKQVYLDHIHLNEYGNELISNQIIDLLEKNKIIKKIN
jgi:lysophospholipase L1-like esterase